MGSYVESDKKIYLYIYLYVCLYILYYEFIEIYCNTIFLYITFFFLVKKKINKYIFASKIIFFI